MSRPDRRWRRRAVLFTVAAIVTLSGGCATASDPHGGVVRSADGVAIHYDVHGEPAGSPTLVLIHGWSNNRSYWADHVPSLARTHPVVTLDLPGFGESGTNRRDWTMEAYGEDVAAVLEELDLDRAILVGFSMGGIAALEAAADGLGRVAGVVLVDVLHDPDAGMPTEIREAAVEDIRRGWGDPGWVRRTGFSEDTPPHLIERYIRSVPGTVPPHWWESFRAALRWFDEEAIATLSAVEVPVAAINSDYVPTDVETYRRLVPSFSLRTMPGKGHLGVLWEDAEIFDGHLRALIREMAAEGRDRP